MEFVLGTESLRDYLSYEVAAAAQKLVRDVMLAKPGEHVAITADTSSDGRVVEATAKAAYAAGTRPVVLWYQTTLGSGVEPPRPVAAAIADCDVWIEYAVGYTLYSDAFRRAMDRGVRYICLSGMDAEMMVRTIGRVDYPKLVAMGERLRALMAAARRPPLRQAGRHTGGAHHAGRADLLEPPGGEHQWPPGL